MKKLLVIEDNPEERKLLRTYLQHSEYEVLEAEDGFKGLEITKTDKPDIIVFDLFMPVMDGFQFLNEIKSDENTKNITAIAYSSVYTEHETKNLIHFLGADGYIPKGKDFQEFMTALNLTLRDISLNIVTDKDIEKFKQDEFFRRYSSVLLRKFEEEHEKYIKVQKKIFLNEEKYRNLFNSIKDVILVTSTEREILDVNSPAINNVFGYERNEILGKNTRLLYFSDEEYERAGQEFFYSEENIFPQYSKYTFKRKDGTVVIGEVHAFKLLSDEGKVLGNVALIKDITEKEMMEKKLSESESRLKLIIKSTNIGLWSFNIKTGEVYLSPEWKKQLGYEDEEIPNDNNEFTTRLHPEDKERIISVDKDYLNFFDKLYKEEFRLRHKDGTYRWILSEGTAIKDEKGEPAYVIGSHIDITDRKLAEQKIEESYKKASKTLEDIIYTMAKIVEIRDPFTSGHQQRVADLTTAIAREMGLEEDRIKGLYLISLVHDIGKIYIPSEVLNKPSKLNNFEFNIVKTHAELGYDILKNIEFPWPVAKVVQQYHERLDGSGYPRGLKGEEIMLEARILAVADVVEAMSSRRPHRPACSLEAVLMEIETGKGIIYDSEVVDVCLKLFREKDYKLLPS